MLKRDAIGITSFPSIYSTDETKEKQLSAGFAQSSKGNQMKVKKINLFIHVRYFNDLFLG